LDTTTASNGSHSLTAKAYDAALNVGTSTAVGVTVNNPTGTDISGWTVTQANATVVYTIPAGTVIPANGYVVIGRDATKAAFQTFWGVTLGSNVIYLTTARRLPADQRQRELHAQERQWHRDRRPDHLDSVRRESGSAPHRSLHRRRHHLELERWRHDAGQSRIRRRSRFARKASSSTNSPTPRGPANFIYEFVELHNDK